MRTRPELFDFTVHATGATWPGVKDFHAYHEAIAQSMIAKGYCARFDGEEIVAKKENRFSEHFDVFLGEGFVRRGEGIYRSTGGFLARLALPFPAGEGPVPQTSRPRWATMVR